MLAEKMTGTSIGQIAANLGAEVVEVENVDTQQFFIPAVGYEPRLVGAISANPAGVSRPVEGNMGVFAFSVKGSHDSDRALSQSDARINLNAQNLYYITERAMQALNEESDIEDLRAKFF
jgi:peptidyl-prolyl cis-trans isomerase D